MPDEPHPIVGLTDEGLARFLRRALRDTVLLGAIPALIVWIGSNWRNAAMVMTGAAISAASIFEWQRLLRIISAKMDRKQTPRGAALAAVFFVFRLMVFGAAIYGSLKCFRGSIAALFYGLSLAIISLFWEALQLLKD